MGKQLNTMNSMSVIDLRDTVVSVDTMDSNMVYCPKG